MHQSRTWVRSSLAFLSFVAPFAVSALARAESKCGDTTCPKNWECKTGSQSVDIACAPEEPCPASEPTTFEFCSPLPCSTDADCASDMVCYTETSEVCSDTPPCAKDGDCAAPADTGCTKATRSACVPRYVPPCETAADCGTGFSCEVQEPDCACGGSTGSAGGGSKSNPSGGSAGSSGSDPAAAPDAGAGEVPPDAVPADGGSAPTPPDDCVCEASTEKACRLTLVGCTAASDCPSGFTCEANPSGGCWASSDGSSGCDTPDPAKICAPPYTDLVGGAGHREDAIGSTTSTPKDDGSEPPKGGTGLSGTETGSSATPRDDAAAADQESSSGGCSVGRSGRTGGAELGLLALAAVVLAGTRRRRSR